MRNYLTILKNKLVSLRSSSVAHAHSKKQYGSIVFAGEDIEFTVINTRDQVVYRRRMCHDVGIIVKQLTPFVPTTRALVIEHVASDNDLVKGLIKVGFRVHLVNITMAEPYADRVFRRDNADPELLARMLRLSYRHKLGIAGRFRIRLGKKAGIRLLPERDVRHQGAVRGS